MCQNTDTTMVEENKAAALDCEAVDCGIEEDIVIEISGLEKVYGTKKAVSKASFSVKRGEIMGFLGPNGAGKSTTMNILTGYLSPSSGTVKVDGLDILEHPKEAKKKIGYLPENPPLYFDMTVFEYLDFAYDLKKVKLNKEEHLEEIMKLVKILNVKDRMIKNLSKGYKQRVGLAQALIGNPDVLVLDEPTVGLDPKQIIEIRNVIKEIGKSRTIILSTHILQEVSAVCDRVTVINKGHIIVSDSLINIQEKMGDKGKYLLRVAGTEVQAREILEKIENIRFMGYVGKRENDTVDFMVEAEEGFDIRKNIFEAFAAANLPLVEFKSTELSLEEIFIRLTNSAEFIPEDEVAEVKESFLKRLFKKNDEEKKEAESDAETEEKSEADENEESEVEENESNIQ